MVAVTRLHAAKGIRPHTAYAYHIVIPNKNIPIIEAKGDKNNDPSVNSNTVAILNINANLIKNCACRIMTVNAIVEIRMEMMADSRRSRSMSFISSVPMVVASKL